MFFQIFKQDFQNLIKNPAIIMMGFFNPVVLILVLGYLFSGMYDTPQISAYDYYGISILLYMIGNAVTLVPNAFMERSIKNANMRIAYTPVSKWVIYSSKVFASFIYMSIALSINIVLLQSLHIVNFGGTNMLFIILLFLSLLFLVCALGSYVCIWLKNEEMTNKILSLTMSILALFAGVFFPIASLGEIAIQVSKFSMITWFFKAILQIIYDNNFMLFMPVIICSLLVATIIFFAGYRRYQPKDFI